MILVLEKELILYFYYRNETDQIDQTSFSLHLHPVRQFTNLLPIDIQCSFDVSQRSYFNYSDDDIEQKNKDRKYHFPGRFPIE